MTGLFHKINRSIVAATTLVAAALGLGSCSLVTDDLDPCPQGVRLRFVYDYNMEFANAFPAQVDCLTLLVYDEAGNYVRTITETSSVLADENWRMTIDLPAGQKYRFVAYGGLECDKSSFHFVDTPAVGSKLTSLEVAMDDNCIDADPGVDLHPLFYGNLDLAVPANSMNYTEGTVYMLRDTNSIRIILQNVDGTPVNPDDFVFEIEADNTLMGWNNDVIPTPAGITYSPWVVDQKTIGSVDNGDLSAVAYAEFSVARFIDNAPVTLNVTGLKFNQKVLSIPLIKYLLMFKSDNIKTMDNQEYLDRENHWDIILFINGERWIDTYIVINDWIVRINNADLL